ncbi:MAG: hypothetical protein E6I72_10525 [Chloroflexi bacterium]|nr:MAG: hypothetical protein E6I72_10525 [Chloroflexota bacterium]
MKRSVFAAAIGLLLSGCGAYAGPAAPSHSPGAGFDLVATDTDHAVTMRSGQRLEVVLHAPNGMNNWTHPQSSDTSVLAPIVDPAATAARGVTLAAFQAVKPGQADVTANASPMCSPGSACPMYLAVYSLKVTVKP